MGYLPFQLASHYNQLIEYESEFESEILQVSSMTASSYYFPPILLICDDVRSHSVVLYVNCRLEYSGTYKLRHVEEEVFSGTYSTVDVDACTWRQNGDNLTRDESLITCTRVQTHTRL